MLYSLSIHSEPATDILNDINKIPTTKLNF